MVGEIISEWWATSNRNGGRDHSGILGDIERNQQRHGLKQRDAGKLRLSDVKEMFEQMRDRA
jgi:hypothetical protein